MTLIALHYIVELQEPALLTLLEGEPNSARSADFVPGSTVRGALLSRLARETGSGAAGEAADLAGQERRFFDGRTVRFLNAYLTGDASRGANERSLPIPRSLRKNKYAAARADGEVLRDEGHSPLPRTEESRPAQWRDVSGYGLWYPGPALAPREARRRVSVHTARENRNKGRATRDAGAVFRYDALEAGQRFRGVVLCTTEEDAAFVRQRLPEIRALGGARTGAYGQVTITVEDLPDEYEYDEPEDGAAEAEAGETAWRECPLPRPTPEERVLVVLLSDALLRDPATGQWAVDPAVLAGALKPGLTAERAFLGEQIVGGFNRRWGLPLPQAQAVARGSALVLAAGSLTPDEMDALERDGIGERREDGFGRVAFVALVETWNVLAAPAPLGAGAKPEAAPIPLPKSSAADLLRRRIAHNRYERGLREAVLQSASALERRDLKPSQIGRLRTRLRQELQKQDPDRAVLTDFLTDLRPTARRQFERARVDKTPLAQWLKDWATSEPALAALPRFGEAEAPEPSPQDKARWALRHVDAVLARLAKLPGEEDRGTNGGTDGEGDSE